MIPFRVFMKPARFAMLEVMGTYKNLQLFKNAPPLLGSAMVRRLAAIRSKYLKTHKGAHRRGQKSFENRLRWVQWAIYVKRMKTAKKLVKFTPKWINEWDIEKRYRAETDMRAEVKKQAKKAELDAIKRAEREELRAKMMAKQEALEKDKSTLILPREPLILFRSSSQKARA